MSSLSTSANYNQHSLLNDKKFIAKDNTPETSKRSINSYNLKFYEIKNIYNKLDLGKLKGIKRYENFPVFSVRERDNKKKKKLILRVKNNVFSLKKYSSHLSSKSSVYITQNSSLGEFSQLPSIFDRIETINSKKVKKIINYKNSFNLTNKNNENLSKIEKNPIRNLFLYKLRNDFKKEREEKINKSTKFLFNKKLYELNRFRTCENSPSTHISKFREFLNNKIIYKFKKERFSQLQESKRNQLEFENDRIYSLHNSQRLLDQQYIIKCKKFILGIYKEMDIQDNINNILIKRIVEMKESIYLLKKKINKLLLEKNVYIKWMIFQVQINEKLLKIPNEYKEFLKIENYKKLPDKLLKYRKEIIYPSPEELIDKITSYENHNIKLMETLNQITKSLFPLKNKLQNIILANQKNRNIKEFNELLLLKEQEKTKNEILIERKIDLEKNLKIIPIKSSKNENSSKLYQKIKFIYNNIKGKEIQNQQIMSIEEEMLNMLTLIEITYDKENEKMRYYNKYNKDKLKLVKIKIIKDKIKEKMMKNKDNLYEKKVELNKRIYEKSSKAILLPTIKINWNVFQIKKNRKTLINMDNNSNKGDEEIEKAFEFFKYE